MMPRAVRTLVALTAALAASIALGACGTEGIEVSSSDPNYTGAVLFAERCGGCHTLDAAGTQGSANRRLRDQGPNLNERVESEEDVLYAIRNGGFSGAIMPQNIFVGDEAEAVAQLRRRHRRQRHQPPADSRRDHHRHIRRSLGE